MEFIESINIEQIIMYIVGVIGAASMISKGITKITRITPNTRDDEWASKLARGVSYLQSIIDRLALNPKADEARK